MTRRTITTRPLDEVESGHLTEFLYDDGENDRVAVCAAHGGEVEPGTAETAIELATRLDHATCWACLGFDEEDAFERWHPPSTAFDPDAYPLLGRIADRGFETVISLHGLADEGVIVGGAAGPDARRRVGEALDAALDVEVRTVSSGEYAGVHPENVVNRLAADAGGIQVEAGPAVRADAPGAVVDVLASLVSEGRI